MSDDPKRGHAPPAEGAQPSGAADLLKTRLKTLNTSRQQTRTLLGIQSSVSVPASAAPAPGEAPAPPAPEPEKRADRAAALPPLPTARLSSAISPPAPRAPSIAAPPAAAPFPPAPSSQPIAPPAPAPAPRPALPGVAPFTAPDTHVETPPEPLPPGPSPIDLAPHLAAPQLPLSIPPSGAVPREVMAESAVTSKRPLVESTPPPLPPSPAAAHAEVWFEEAPTRPSALSDIAPSVPGRTPAPPLFGPSGSSTAAGKTSARRSSDPSATELVAALPSPRARAPAQRVAIARAPWLIPVLAAGAAFTIGLTLGAALFGAGDTAPSSEPPRAVLHPLVLPMLVPVATPAAPVEAQGAAEAVPPPGVAPVAEGCSLRVESTPPGAVVTLRGADAGKTPLDATTPCGELVVGVETARFEPWSRKITLVEATPAKVVASLRRPRVKVDVASTPSGATVLVGGKPAGKTPVKIDVAAYATTTVKLTLPGFQPFSQAISPKPGKPAAIRATLVKELKKPAPRRAP